jgi:hypothetical protein
MARATRARGSKAGPRPLLVLLLLAASLFSTSSDAAAAGGAAAAHAAGRWIGDHLPSPSILGDVAAPAVGADGAASADPAAGLHAAYHAALRGVAAARERAARLASAAGGAAARGEGAALEALAGAEGRLRAWGRALLHPHSKAATDDETHNSPSPSPSSPLEDDAPPTAAPPADAPQHLAALQLVVVPLRAALPADLAARLPPDGCGPDAAPSVDGGGEAVPCDPVLQTMVYLGRLVDALYPEAYVDEVRWAATRGDTPTHTSMVIRAGSAAGRRALNHCCLE